MGTWRTNYLMIRAAFTILLLCFHITLLPGQEPRSSQFYSKMWELATFEHSLETFGISPQHGTLAMAGDDRYVLVTDYISDELLAHFSLDEVSASIGPVRNIQLYDSLVAIVDAQGALVVASWKSKQVLHRSTGHSVLGGPLSFSETGTHLYVSNEYLVPENSSVEEIDCTSFTVESIPVEGWLAALIPDRDKMHIVLQKGSILEYECGQGTVSKRDYINKANVYVEDADYSSESDSYVFKRTSPPEIQVFKRGDVTSSLNINGSSYGQVSFLERGSVICEMAPYGIRYYDAVSGSIIGETNERGEKRYAARVSDTQVAYMKSSDVVSVASSTTYSSTPLSMFVGHIQSIITNRHSGNTYIVQYRQPDKYTILSKISEESDGSLRRESFIFDLEASDVTSGGSQYECIIASRTGNIWGWEGSADVGPWFLMNSNSEYPKIEFAEDRGRLYVVDNSKVCWYSTASWELLGTAGRSGAPLDLKYEPGRRYLVIRINMAYDFMGPTGAQLFDLKTNEMWCEFSDNAYDFLYNSDRWDYNDDSSYVNLVEEGGLYRTRRDDPGMGQTSDLRTFNRYLWGAEMFANGQQLLMLYRDGKFVHYSGLRDPHNYWNMDWSVVQESDMLVPVRKGDRRLFYKRDPHRIYYHTQWFVRCLDLNLVTTSVQRFENSSPVSLYPNPVSSISDELILSSSNRLIERIVVVDLLGNPVWEDSETTRVSVPSIPGVYLVRVLFRDGDIVTKKLLVY